MLPIIKYTDDDEALARANNSDLGLGGSAGGCGCAGASTGTLLQLLEVVQPKLTFEGGRVDGSIWDTIDWTAFYARPHAARGKVRYRTAPSPVF